MSHNDIPTWKAWKYELLERLNKWSKTYGDGLEYKLFQRKYWKVQPWKKSTRPERHSIRYLGNRHFRGPSAPLDACNEFTWIISMWEYHANKYDLRLGEYTEMEAWLQIMELELYISCLKGEVRDAFEVYRDIAIGILRDIAKHESG